MKRFEKRFIIIYEIIVAIGLILCSIFKVADWIMAIYIGMGAGIILAEIFSRKILEILIEKYDDAINLTIEKAKDIQKENLNLISEIKKLKGYSAITDLFDEDKKVVKTKNGGSIKRREGRTK